MLPFKVVYHPRYDLNLGPHVFPSQKFRLIAEELVNAKIADPRDFLTPQPASDEDLLRVHTPSWVNKLKNGKLTASEITFGIREQDRDLQRECEFAVKILMQAIEVARNVLQQQRSRSRLTLIVTLL